MTEDTYEEALARGRALYPGVRIGRPGRARTYWATIAAMRVLRLRWAVDVEGSEHVAKGPAILVGNHVSAMDPVVAVMGHWWRVTAFTKVEVFERRGGIFFRLMGQIPLRRGDNESTAWAMDMATRTLADGNKVGLYPEGTRSPDGRTMHRLHRRVLIPILDANPDVPVHAITTTYPPGGRLRRRAVVRISPRLDIDTRTMEPAHIMDVVREAMISTGNLTYVDVYAQAVKGARRPAAEE
jgi:1-acyl-sn-glycerol-3-phosphate acyltransferase